MVEGGRHPREGSLLELGFLSLQALYFLPSWSCKQILPLSCWACPAHLCGEDETLFVILDSAAFPRVAVNILSTHQALLCTLLYRGENRDVHPSNTVGSDRQVSLNPNSPCSTTVLCFPLSWGQEMEDCPEGRPKERS